MADASPSPEPTTSSGKSDCFVISPFGGWFDKYYEHVFKPAISDAGLKPRRVDDIFRPAKIIEDIWDLVQSAEVLLADMTDKNPNVFYELGLAHASDKPVVLLAQSIEDVPFDLRHLRVITYDTQSPSWAADLQSSITNALREIVSFPEKGRLAPFKKAERTAQSRGMSEDARRAIRLERDLNMQRARNAELEARLEHQSERAKKAGGPRLGIDREGLEMEVAMDLQHGRSETSVLLDLTEGYALPTSVARRVIANARGLVGSSDIPGRVADPERLQHGARGKSAGAEKVIG